MQTIQTTKFAALLLWGGAHHLAAESGIPGAVLLVDPHHGFEVPHQFTGGIYRKGVELNRMARRLENGRRDSPANGKSRSLRPWMRSWTSTAR
ncbi:MAG: hypothetical protein R3B83_05965 [Nitrospirales bacterium]|nr:hypothetical protein [Nitrospirales bacterium]